jgi:hypothetical protein
VVAPSTFTRASFFVRSTVSTLTPASLSKACLTSLSHPPHVMPVTVNRICRVPAMESSFPRSIWHSMHSSAEAPRKRGFFECVSVSVSRVRMKRTRTVVWDVARLSWFSLCRPEQIGYAETSVPQEGGSSGDSRPYDRRRDRDCAATTVMGSPSSRTAMKLATARACATTRQRLPLTNSAGVTPHPQIPGPVAKIRKLSQAIAVTRNLTYLATSPTIPDYAERREKTEQGPQSRERKPSGTEWFSY